MGTDPTISIVLSTHNGQRYIDTAIESVVAQTYRNWELIIVDDASSDDTPTKIAAWVKRDPRIKTIRLPENRKIPGAVNEGYRLAAGELYSRVADDDWFAPEALARMLKVLQSRPEVDVVYTDYTWVDSDGNPLSRESVLPPENLAISNCVGLCFLFRRKVFDQLDGFDEELFLAEDYDFWLRASLDFHLEPLNEVLHFVRRHPGTVSERFPNKGSRVTEKAVKRWLAQAAHLDRKTRGRALEALGLRALIRGDVRAGRRFLFRAILFLRRPPVFRACRTFAVDWLCGARFGNWVRRRLGKQPLPADSVDSTG